MLRCGKHKAVLTKVEVGVEVFEKDVSSSVEHQFEFGSGFVKDEATYSFPLDSYAAVCGFEAFFLDENNKVMKHLISKAKEKEEARQEFEQAKANGQTAQLLENDTELSGDRFTISLGNIPAECKTVKTFIQHLSTLEEETENKTSRLTIPAKLAPRYVSKDLTTLPEGSNIVEDSMFKVNIIFGGTTPLSSVSCLTHPIVTEFNYEGDNKKVKVSFAQDEPSLDKDMILKVVSSEERKNSISIQNSFESENTDFSDSIPTRIRFVAKIPDEIKNQPKEKDFLFLVDRSGSMSGSRMNDAKKALQLCLSSLPENASFDICSFGSNHSFCFGKSVRNNSENLSKARDHVKQMSANMGGTEIQRPLKALIQKAKSTDTVIFLLTDGSIYGTSQLINQVQKDIKSKPIQIFTCGIGNQVSKDLVKGLAEVGRGTATFIAPGERMNAKIIKQLQAASMMPAKRVLLEQENVSLHPASKIFDNKPPEVVFDGEVIDMFTMLKKGAVDGQFKLVGKINNAKYILAEVSLNEAVETNVDLFKVAARAKVKQIERKEKELKSDKKTALKLAIAANLVSKYTSLVSVDVDKPDEEKETNLVKDKPIPIKEESLQMMPKLGAAAGFAPMRMTRALPSFKKPQMLSLRSSAVKEKAVKEKSKRKKKGRTYDKSSTIEETEEAFYSLPAGLNLEEDALEPAFDQSMSIAQASVPPPMPASAPKSALDSLSSPKLLQSEKTSVSIGLKPEEVLDELVLYQNPDGSFNPEEGLVKLLKLENKPGLALMTALVIVYLETELMALKDEWQLLHNKATKFLDAEKEKVSLLEEAKTLLGK